MRIFESGTTSYWLNYFAESIKDVIESKQGKCKIQVSFTGNILFIRGYSTVTDISVDDVIESVVEKNPELHNIFGRGRPWNLIIKEHFGQTIVDADIPPYLRS
jgi:hypothetical protein